MGCDDVQEWEYQECFDEVVDGSHVLSVVPVHSAVAVKRCCSTQLMKLRIIQG